MEPIADSPFESPVGRMTLIGGSADLKDPSVKRPPGSASGLPTGARLPLSMSSVGDRVWVVAIQGGHRMVRRLTDLGIGQGSEIVIVSRSESGSVIVGLQGCRIGLGAGMAHRVLVATTQEATPASQPEPLSSPLSGGSPMPVTCPLGTLEVGQSGRIVGYERAGRAYRGRLLSMGLTPGTHFTVTRQAPLGDPLEIEVRGFKLSLRKGEAATLQVEIVKG